MTFCEGMTVAVTGGCGFIGSHLVERLRLSGARVLVIDSLMYGQRENLGGLDPNVRIEQLELGKGSSERLGQLLQGADYVLHLAAEKHNQSIGSPERLLESNVIGTYELLKAASASKVKKLVFTSSLYAYGRMSGPPLAEEETPLPHTVYGISKLTGEHLCRHFCIKHGLSTVCLRLFFVYGPRQYVGLGYKSVIVKNFDRLLKGEKPVICGDGKQELDYIYVDDVVSAILLAMTNSHHFGLFNVGNGIGLSINELTTLMMEVSSRRSGCEYAPPDFTHGSSRVANTGKFNAHFGLQSRVSIKEGLRRTLRWMVSSHR